MLYRFFALTIVGFWTTMMVLLVRNEVSPATSGLREVPLDHVLKTFFLHEQPSDLTLRAGHDLMGHVRFHPRVEKQTQLRFLDLTGSMQVQNFEKRRQRLTWDAQLELSPELKVKVARFGVNAYQPAPYRAELTVWPQANRAHFELRDRDRLQTSEDYTLDRSGASRALNQLGIDPMLIDTVSAQQKTAVPPVVKARQAYLRVRGEKVETFLVTFEQNGQTMLEAHVSKLGQILKVTTALGYTLAPEDPLP